jgi:hypothetical protein
VPEWFFDEVHRSSNAFDYAVEELRSWPLPSSDPMFETTVVVRRHGEAVFPVDIRVDFEDGSHQLASFAERSERWKILRYTTKARAVRAQVDPDRVLLLDVNLTNNSVTLEPRATQAARKWSLVWMAWLQDLMLTWASFV